LDSVAGVGSNMCAHVFALATSIVFVLMADAHKAEVLSSTYPNDKYKGNQDRRHDWCDLQSKVDPSVHYMKALKGANVSVAFREEDARDQPWNVAMMDEVARRGEFQYRGHAALVESWSHSDRNGDNDWMNWAVDHYDMSMTWFTIDPDRAGANLVRFSYPIVDVDAHLIVEKHVADPSFWHVLFAFMKPLTGWVWLLIALVSIFSAIIYKQLERCGEIQEVGPNSCHQHAQSLFLALGSFTGGGGFTPTTPSGKLFQLSWTFATMLLVSAYTANLASLLVTRPTTSVVMSSLDEAVRKNLEVCNKAPSFISRSLSRRYPDVRTKRTADPYSALREKKCAGFVDNTYHFRKYRRLASKNPLCKLDVVGSELWRASGGWVTRMDMHGTRRCTDFLMNVVSLILQEMKHDGTMHEIMDDWMQGLEGQNDCTRQLEEEEERHSLSFHDTGGIFCIHVFFSVMALLIGMCTSNRSPGDSTSLQPLVAVSVEEQTTAE